MFLSKWREFPSAPCLAGKKNLMTVHVSMLLKSRESLTCFRVCVLPGPTKGLSAPRYLEICPSPVTYVEFKNLWNCTSLPIVFVDKYRSVGIFAGIPDCVVC